MTVYKYPMSSRFSVLNKRVNKAIKSGKKKTIKTNLAAPECVYYFGYLLYNTTILRYANYHAYKDIYEKGVIVYKKTDTCCKFIVYGNKMKDLVDECYKNIELADKVIEETGITKKWTQKRAIREIADYLYYRNPGHTTYRYAIDLLEGRGGNCAAHSSAFKIIMTRLGLPCEFVIGDMDDTCHAWNRVKVAGKWYYIDVTWDRGLRENLWSNYTSITEKF